MAAGLPCRVQGRHKRRVNCELGTAPKRETVGDDLDAPLVLPLNVGDSGPGLTASPSSGSLGIKTARERKQTGAWAGGWWSPKHRGGACKGRIWQNAGTRDSCRRQAAQQHHTVRRRLEPELGGSRQGCDHLGCEGAGLGIQPAIEEGSEPACEGSRKSCVECEGGTPSTSEVGGLVIRLLRQGARGVGELVPSRGLETFFSSQSAAISALGPSLPLPDRKA